MCKIAITRVIEFHLMMFDFITSALDHCTARDLWNVFTAYGKVVDVYIPIKKSKAGMGRFRLHANPVRFQREPRDHKFSTPPKENVGGFWVRIDAGSLTSKEKMLSHVRVAFWFSELQHASDYFVTEERLVWISIKGLPKVTWKFSSCKDCFLMGFTVWLKIIVKGEVYWIRVKELEAWTPEFNNEFCESSTSVRILWKTKKLVNLWRMIENCFFDLCI
nr:RNA-directed DNA polymerase, eukaryota, nucleotide-binding alpha-beta plait domain protein [Tanacetum cinerariifolium]